MNNKAWVYQGNEGEFRLEQPERNTALYFPLVNEAGMMSVVTPNLHGQVTSGHNTFLTEPVSVMDLHNSKASRNFWVYVQGEGAWSVSGNSAKQQAELYSEEKEYSSMEAGFLWHKITRINRHNGLKAETINFVPMTDDKVELMKITLTNGGAQPLTITPTAAIPVYGRSADDLRDHRHVTSLLHRLFVSDYGLEVQPALSFDERGHRINKVTYSVLGAEASGTAPIGLFPETENYIGEGGALDWPESVVSNMQPTSKAGDQLEGYEAIGALRFNTVTLEPEQSVSYVLALMITEDRIDAARFAEKYLSEQAFDALLEQNKSYWQEKLGALAFHSGDKAYDQWMKWVTLQPVLRRLYGNSFLPYHDYGRGGRGWRDLWQDCLALMVMEPEEVRHLLLNNYAGVRIDGSNATIIGSKPGEFVADRNNIPRVWMDHGAWPLLTTLLYIHQSGDVELLLQPQTYFRDSFVKRCKDRDLNWSPEQGNKLLTLKEEIYEGTLLEHILLQNVTTFFHVGEHGNILLEGADWNDGLDMGTKRGESVAFTAFYASNLLELSELLLALHARGQETIEIAEEMMVLFDSITSEAVSYDSIAEKRALLDRYYERVVPSISGKKVSLNAIQAAEDLKRKADWLTSHLRSNEWIKNEEGYEWFNGYYNNDGERVEGDHPEGVRMTLTGQVFPVMGGIATDEQVGKIAQAVDHYLKDSNIGYRLNSRFGGIQQNLGRAFGFAFGHKENGAMFSHMTVMYANALYKRGFVTEGYDVLNSIYTLSSDFDKSRMYPGVPEYINEKGRGMYTYLTGSASWLLLTQLTEVFGVKGHYGDLVLEPKLVSAQFNESGRASVETLFAGVKLNVTYINPANAEYGEYNIASVSLNGEAISYQGGEGRVSVDRALLTALPAGQVHEIEVILS